MRSAELGKLSQQTRNVLAEMVERMRETLDTPVTQPTPTPEAESPEKAVHDSDCAIHNAGVPELAGWITWKGGPQPVAHDVMVLVKLKDGQVSAIAKQAGLFFWDRDCAGGTIIAYKLARTDPAGGGK